MSKIIMLRLTTGEDIICEIVKVEGRTMHVTNCVHLALVPSRGKPGEQSYGFLAFPNYAQAKSKVLVELNMDQIVFSLPEVDKEFLDQYNTVFQTIVVPKSRIII